MKKFSLFFCLIFCIGGNSFADHTEPTAKTNVNVKTDLFQKSVGDVAELEAALEGSKGKAVEGIGDPSSITGLTGKSAAEIEEQNAKLQSMKADDLNARGREAYIKEEGIDDLFVDPDRPLYTAHQRDAESLANATGALLGKLTKDLKELGIDCKTVKGDKEIEPAYYIDVKRESVRNTKYNKTICEELRNRYNCTDSVKLTCKRRELKWEAWQDKTILISGEEIYWHHHFWVYGIKWGDSRYGIHVKEGNAHVMSDARRLIAQKTGVSNIEHIHPHIANTGRGEGAIWHIEGKHVIWQNFRFNYKYRDGSLVCAEWQEDWTEQCRLQ